LIAVENVESARDAARWLRDHGVGTAIVTLGAGGVVLATGTEVEVAMDARGILQDKGIGTRVVSMPCWEIFRSQDEKYRRQILPAGPVRVAVEAGGRLGWE